MELLKFFTKFTGVHSCTGTVLLCDYMAFLTFLLITDSVATTYVDTSTHDIYKSEYKELASGRVKLQSNTSAAKITIQVMHL